MTENLIKARQQFDFVTNKPYDEKDYKRLVEFQTHWLLLQLENIAPLIHQIDKLAVKSRVFENSTNNVVALREIHELCEEVFDSFACNAVDPVLQQLVHENNDTSGVQRTGRIS